MYPVMRARAWCHQTNPWTVWAVDIVVAVQLQFVLRYTCDCSRKKSDVCTLVVMLHANVYSFKQRRNLTKE